MTEKHTPAPWHWTERPSLGLRTNTVLAKILIGGRSGGPQRRVVTPDPRCVPPSSADCALMAAAPELLAALKAYMYADASDHPEDYIRAARLAASAVAKAEGAEPPAGVDLNEGL